MLKSDKMATDAETSQARNDGFKEWMERDEVRALLSLLPSSSGGPLPELMTVVLRSAHAAGFNAGIAHLGLELAKRMLESRGKDSL